MSFSTSCSVRYSRERRSAFFRLRGINFPIFRCWRRATTLAEDRGMTESLPIDFPNNAHFREGMNSRKLHPTLGSLLRQLHLAQERLVARVIGQIPKKRSPDDIFEGRILLLVGAFKPLQRKIAITAIRVVHGYIRRTCVGPS